MLSCGLASPYLVVRFLFLCFVAMLRERHQVGLGPYYARVVLELRLLVLAPPVLSRAGVRPGCSSDWREAGHLVFLAEVVRCYAPWRSYFS